MNRTYQIKHGDVWYVSEPTHAEKVGILNPSDVHICDGSEHLAIAYQNDEDNSYAVMKHGCAHNVQQWADNQRAKLSASGFSEMAAGLSMVSFPVHEATVAILNRVVAGQSHDFLQRLEALQDVVPATAPFPR